MTRTVHYAKIWYRDQQYHLSGEIQGIPIIAHKDDPNPTGIMYVGTDAAGVFGDGQGIEIMADNVATSVNVLDLYFDIPIKATEGTPRIVHLAVITYKMIQYHLSGTLDGNNITAVIDDPNPKGPTYTGDDAAELFGFADQAIEQEDGVTTQARNIHLHHFLDLAAPKYKQEGWKVSQRGRQIDTVFFTGGMSAQEVKDSLVNHDGMPPNITVVREA